MKEVISDKRGVIAADGTAKARIERAALTLFTESSIEGASTKSIAQLAGVSEGLLYRHFNNKDDLARNLMQTIHSRLTLMIRFAADLPLDEAIDKIVGTYCALADDDWDLFRYHILHLHRFPGLSGTGHDSPIGAAAEIVRAAQARGDINKAADPVLTATMALGVVLSAAQAKVLGALKQPLSAHEGEFNRIVMAVLNAA